MALTEEKPRARVSERTEGRVAVERPPADADAASATAEAAEVAAATEESEGRAVGALSVGWSFSNAEGRKVLDGTWGAPLDAPLRFRVGGVFGFRAVGLTATREVAPAMDAVLESEALSSRREGRLDGATAGESAPARKFWADVDGWREEEARDDEDAEKGAAAASDEATAGGAT